MSIFDDNKFNTLDLHRLRADVAAQDKTIPTGKYEDLDDPARLLRQVNASLNQKDGGPFNRFSYLDPSLALRQMAIAYD